MNIRAVLVALIATLALSGCAVNAGAENPAIAREALAPAPVPISASAQEIQSTLDGLVSATQAQAKNTLPLDALFPPRAGIEKTTVEGHTLAIDFKPAMTDRAWTPESKAELEAAIRQALGGKLPPNAPLRLTIAGEAFDTYVTSVEQIRKRQEERTAQAKTLAQPVVQFPDDPSPRPAKGLQGRNLVVGPSHGWYYSDAQHQWQYQRCRLFTIVEDLYPMSYINPFLIPMLENAGATVFTMRERDFQTAEVIVDNEGELNGSDFTTTGTWATSETKGWRGGLPMPPLDETAQPFTLGTTLQTQANPDDSTNAPAAAAAAYTPFFAKAGQYAVYASWASSPLNSPAVPVTIHHLGGETTVLVNQQVAGNTWVFLGFFQFAEGKNAAKGSVVVSARGATASAAATKEGRPTMISVDAVRFGGGMGNIAVEGQTSGHPRYAEACRYWAQYAGGPNGLVVHRDLKAFASGRDYNRDVIARPEWTNYINGAPGGPDVDTNAPGLGVPIDASLSFHTDAGISQDGLIGTLSIYRIKDQNDKERFPDGRSRYLNRDLAAMVHDEICRSVRANFTSQWARRQLRDGNYGESRRPNMPTVLLELLSHQNFNDMKYGNDPRFKREVARAIYKAMARFIAASNGYDAVISPLAPTHLTTRHLGAGKVMLAWRAQDDPIEPSARADGFIVYQSNNGAAFDNGRYVTEPQALIEDVPEGQTRYFRVTAANAGGKSFPSRVVAVRWLAGAQPVLIVDGFDRICGPAIVEKPDSRGFSRAVDPGVGYIATYGLTGDQYDNHPKSEFLTNDQPGWGASERDWEDRLERGNTFDHVVPHAKALADAKQAFDSATSDAYSAGEVRATYRAIDWIAGRERATPPPAGITGVGKPDRMKTEFVVLDTGAREILRRHIAAGGSLILSGAYVIEDLTAGPSADEDSRRFAREILGVASYEARATETNAVKPTAGAAYFGSIEPFRFGRDLEQTVYSVESAESLAPVSTLHLPVLEYGDTGRAAAIAAGKVVVFGFPLETVLPEKTRTALVTAAIQQIGLAK